MIIETRSLTKKFWRHDAVRGLSLAVPEGAVCALVGANGAGKTTLMRMLVNILKPDSGSAQVLGVDSRHLAPADFLRIGYVSENQELPDRLSVAHYFDYLRALYPGWDAAFERELRAGFELPPARPLGKLSRGTRMKVKIAGALSFRPKLLILDEPLSGLDPLVRDEVMSGMLSQAGETTILISSHEIAEIEGGTTHVAFMVRGRLLLQEPVESLCARYRDVNVTLEAPAMDQSLPPSWMNVHREGPMVSFTETAFVDDRALRELVEARLGRCHYLEASAMSLLEISKATMRATREAE
ncbi:MAG TPA: ABC transporter ATP-binding protein [Steroidobacteraceae bacterium]|nr:ABC transporter ATP-binding protein [Steroidobacteraceae bacterium]